MPLGFRPLDLIVVFVIALLIFGPKRLPEMGKSIAQSIQMFKKGMSELTAPKEESLPAETLQSSRAVDAARQELEALERELAAKKAAAAAQESAQPEVETYYAEKATPID